MASEHEGAYSYVLDRAFALQPGGSFTLEAGHRKTYGLFGEPTTPKIAAIRVRVKLHQFAQAKRKRIRVRLEPNGVDVQVYRQVAK